MLSGVTADTAIMTARTRNAGRGELRRNAHMSRKIPNAVQRMDAYRGAVSPYGAIRWHTATACTARIGRKTGSPRCRKDFKKGCRSSPAKQTKNTAKARSASEANQFIMPTGISHRKMIFAT